MHLSALSSVIAGLALAVALAACPSKPTPAPVSTAGGESTGGEPADGECTTDDDCVVSCEVANQCCGQPCAPCDQVFSRREDSDQLAWRVMNCIGQECPLAECAGSDNDIVARCRDGECVAEAIGG